jgi:diaminohydroxyphosphoribosylaminopyrimidine deaminase/5-amino-6-(5-phosphoribosylamino)uracil reductase
MAQTQATTRSDAQVISAMAAALSAARRFEGATAPNPPVGCAIMNAKGDVIAIAAHARAGEAHAEAAAIAGLSQEGRLADIHTIVVTLEPCNHTGRTPPCCDAILATPAKRVVYGVADPNPAVAGGGAARLRKAGLDVELFSGNREQLERLIAPFAKRVTQGLPFVTVKQAVSRDGSMIPPAGQKTFTSQGSLVIAHALRRRADAIITGSGTILADDPHFTVRLLPDHDSKRRKLVILDRRRLVPASYLHEASARGFDVRQADDLKAALQALADESCNEALLEAGPALTASMLASPFWDEHVRISQTEGEDRVEILTPGGRHVLRYH